ARNTDASAVRSDKFGDDCQSQPRATAVLAPRPRLLQPVEALEDSWQFFFRNARAVIGNDTLDPVAVGTADQPHVAAARRVGQGVVGQIRKNLAESIGVSR